MNYPLKLIPEYRDYIWGGSRLRPGVIPTAEAWIIYEKDLVANGPFAGQSLAQLVEENGAALMGKCTKGRFPVLIKLLDCAQWLSLQVHPDDKQAVYLEGSGQSGKTEAWHVLEAEDGAQLIAGFKLGVTHDAAASAIRCGQVLEHVQQLPVHAGDTIFIRAGTIHALGPGLLIYEVQQTSDITYRVYDWGRPQTAGRVLHIDKSLTVIDPARAANPILLPPALDGTCQTLCSSAYFTLETLTLFQRPAVLDTQGETFHALTVVEGAACLTCAGIELKLGRFESALIPACLGSYTLHGLLPSARLLIASAGQG